MNSRSLLTSDSICDSSTFSSVLPEERTRVNIPVVNRQTRNSPPFLIRLLMKMSRARWYSFLRRVYHYQNASGSGFESNPFDTAKWMMMEFICLVVQISSTVYTLSVSKAEKPVWPMRIWVAGYAFGCFLSLVPLFLRYRLVFANRRGGSSVYDIEQQRSHEESGSLQFMNNCRTSLELLFALWFVMGNVWIFDSRLDSYSRSPKLNILCISVLAWNAISYSFPFLLFMLLCCFVPLLSSLLGYNMNAASLERGATDDQLASLLSWKYKDVGTNLEVGESDECCICLAKYMEKEEIRQLPCTHVFHLKCVDQWLKIFSCCPLCKQGIEK